MKIYKEFMEFAKCLKKVKKVITKIRKTELEFDAGGDGLDWGSTEIVTLGKSQIKKFERANNVTDDYYVEQRTGYCDDDFYGYLYFKTEIENKYVRVPFFW